MSSLALRTLADDNALVTKFGEGQGRGSCACGTGPDVVRLAEELRDKTILAFCSDPRLNCV